MYKIIGFIIINVSNFACILIGAVGIVTMRAEVDLLSSKEEFTELVFRGKSNITKNEFKSNICTIFKIFNSLKKLSNLLPKLFLLFGISGAIGSIMIWYGYIHANSQTNNKTCMGHE